MVISKEQLTQYLPAVEDFLTSLLLEETEIAVDSFEQIENDFALDHFNDPDIFIYTRENITNLDVILVLDQQWYGLLSSIMLGIEEKEKNEKTIELLEEFSHDLAEVIADEAGEQELEFDLEDVQVLSHEEIQDEMAHRKYLWTELGIEGVADNKVRADLLLGDPNTKIKKTSDAEQENDDEKEKPPIEPSSELSSFEKPEEEEDFSTLETDPAKQEKRKEKVISARHIDFANFTDENGNVDTDGNTMEMLKDVELDLSVELGRIELPLGKVLELAKGSVIELEKLAGEPVDILVNGNRIALGEVVVIDEHFGVRISSLVTTKKRLAKIENGS